MRVCLASIHPRRMSGQIESLIALAEQLGRLGAEVKVASAFAPVELGGFADEGAAGMVAKLRRVWHATREVVRGARGAELLFLNLPTPAFACLADIVRALTRLPVVVGFEAHLASPMQLLLGGYLTRDVHFYLPRFVINNRLVARCALYRCERYVVSSRLQRDELARLGVPADRVCVLPNLTHKRVPTPPRAPARAGLGLPDGPLVTYIGHFHHVKGADVLAAAFPWVLRQQPDARLAIAWSGIGDPRPVVRCLDEAGVRDKTTWLGLVDVGAVMAASDVLVLPYRLTIGQNAFPNLLLEALEVGVPLVTSRLPLLAELLRDGETALLCPPDDPARLGQAISRLLGDAAQRDRMRERQRALFARQLAPERLGRRYYQLFLEVRHGQAEVLQPAARRP